MDNSLAKRYINQHIELFGEEIFSDIGLIRYSITDDLKSSDQILLDYKSLIENFYKDKIEISKNNLIFGSGDSKADLLLIGEAPGDQENLKGEPFIGKSGKLLDKILKAIGYNRSNKVYLTYIIKWRLPDDRDPLPSEVEECFPFLIRQINIIKPKIIVALGKVAGKILLKKDIILKEARNKKYFFNNIPLVVTYHPASLLRNQSLKKESWEDFKYIRDFLKSL